MRHAMKFLLTLSALLAGTLSYDPDTLCDHHHGEGQEHHCHDGGHDHCHSGSDGHHCQGHGSC